MFRLLGKNMITFAWPERRLASLINIMDIEGELLSRFSTLGTTDHDVLIAEFRKFVGDQTPDASCAFFLDMNNWLVLY